MGYTPMMGGPRVGGNQMAGYQAPFYPQQAMNMNMGMP